MSDEENETFAHAMVMSNCFVVPMVLNAAVELDVFKIIDEAGNGGQVSAKEIASRLPTNNPNASCLLDRMLHLLANHSFLTCTLHDLENGMIERLYGLGPASKFYLEDEHGGSLASMPFLASCRAIWEAWNCLKDCVLEGGIPFNKAFGMPVYQYVCREPIFNDHFHQAMSGHSILFMKKLFEIYKGFEGINSLVDVGGGKGTTLNSIINMYPSIRGINFDLPHVIRGSPSYIGVEHIGGSMFETVPHGDAILLKRILHNWDDEDCIKILKNCYNALPEAGKVIIIDGLMLEGADTSFQSKYIAHLDLHMFTLLGGRERSEREFAALAKAAGYSNYRLACYVYCSCVVELFK
ncbi:Plant methyltransferase dimerization [Dillenia turbinata]|uniref:Plant methyltransferase dimerization n=1 Tax=Dillenia turbinata TaxID=194707 RepID=A0AAN8VNT8_9MAGN